MIPSGVEVFLSSQTIFQMKKVHKIVLADHELKLREIAYTLKISEFGCNEEVIGETEAY